MVGGPTGPAGPLLRRRDAKASAALSGSPSPADAADRGRFPVDRGIVRNLSDAQLALYRQCFPDGSGGINFPAFQRCFEQFSNGELRSSSPTLQKKGVREPNGGFYFLFAELRFCASIRELAPTSGLKHFVCLC
jgi:hypothetical protein